jgi:hypothetical protein
MNKCSRLVKFRPRTSSAGVRLGYVWVDKANNWGDWWHEQPITPYSDEVYSGGYVGALWELVWGCVGPFCRVDKNGDSGVVDTRGKWSRCDVWQFFLQQLFGFSSTMQEWVVFSANFCTCHWSS